MKIKLGEFEYEGNKEDLETVKEITTYIVRELNERLRTNNTIMLLNFVTVLFNIFLMIFWN